MSQYKYSNVSRCWHWPSKVFFEIWSIWPCHRIAFAFRNLNMDTLKEAHTFAFFASETDLVIIFHNAFSAYILISNNMLIPTSNLKQNMLLMHTIYILHTKALLPEAAKTSLLFHLKSFHSPTGWMSKNDYVLNETCTLWLYSSTMHNDKW